MVNRIRDLVIGLACGIVVTACALPKFPYKFYTLKAVNYDGSLLGPTPAEDLNLKECMPPLEKPNKAMCMVVPVDVYLRLKKDYLDTKIDLEKCERGQ
jgi:hypothetical protein